LKQLKKDYWNDILKEYVRIRDYTKPKYILNPYKKFMKATMWITEYKNNLVKNLWKYWTYLLSIQEYAREDNSIDMNYFKEEIWMSDSSFIRLIKSYKDNWILKKSWNVFYLNPLIVHYWKDIRIQLAIMFKDELEKVWIEIK